MNADELAQAQAVSAHFGRAIQDWVRRAIGRAYRKITGETKEAQR